MNGSGKKINDKNGGVLLVSVQHNTMAAEETMFGNTVTHCVALLYQICLRLNEHNRCSLVVRLNSRLLHKQFLCWDFSSHTRLLSSINNEDDGIV